MVNVFANQLDPHDIILTFFLLGYYIGTIFIEHIKNIVKRTKFQFKHPYYGARYFWRQLNLSRLWIHENISGFKQNLEIFFPSAFVWWNRRQRLLKCLSTVSGGASSSNNKIPERLGGGGKRTLCVI